MRLDQKYFNRFIVIMGALGMIAITFFTLRHSAGRITDFEDRLNEVHFTGLSFLAIVEPDSLSISQFQGNPVVLYFWSTWSSRSQEMGHFLERFSNSYPGLVVIAAAVRDDNTLIRNYISETGHPFHHVEGTQFYQSILVPGMPSQILLDQTGSLFDFQVGGDTLALKLKLEELMSDHHE